MKIKSSEFIISAVKPSQYPQTHMPEIALAGRSNVGKSSLINMLVNRKKLAKTSSVPGKTQTINFYLINNEFHLVDLPGYGYAKVSKRSQEEWGKIIETYLTSRENLVEVLQLVDIRHKPTVQDKQMYEWIKHFGFKGIVVATKLDKIKRSQRQKQISIIRKELGMDKDDVLIPVSSLNREGKEELWEVICSIFIDKGLNITIEKAAEL
ncbi:GTP-binding protein [Caminicella sporogenes DSM 14501]|uniref:Probable GTP-binding protein EngB n=1 Tax=Caminicella sporogenes DSM 14501 TaxID=1121266 RepID=A0A1M6NYS6_9FIRM|nr:ribosome biogenesis GTP-binding protein YihA/YsxC [Caminicella sporogenes]RKD21595.1 YihA family ribosome biogenesis GTP-binding protein [Caminicella sporogenes]WIF94120.1 ribosome biogenesis GTP-binding protein YihA/YsxC [Caminicella sporogenes]SHK00798.1 GTP-binding protein [Caminicella sporogenes DSM 14501]